MPNYSKSDIQAQRNALTAAIAEIDASIDELEKIEKAVTAVAAQIKKIGEPHFSDDAAIDTLHKAELKQRILERARATAESRVQVALKALQEIFTPSATLCTTILEKPVEERIQEIAANFRPFYREDHMAYHAARMSDAGECAGGIALRLNTTASQLTGSGKTSDQLCAFAKQLLEILDEALAAKPTWERFWKFSPQRETAPNS